ncbi:hypothetical protein ACM7LV_08820 [Pseudomonas aeruginosa]|uniref:hypothetical protein n=1 Tax=Pseudomonas aeruginosa TaxID=287 RepID=UPI00053EA6D8|nr:hypothetical protein [Pseudomonas aeruginosa]AXR13657.1 hypothetical protein DZ899_26805 [Pseudomonas aeruginosa]KSJ89422.1 hypothetical protein APA20_06915 [Pseudomonas aeruginosa]MCO2043252.1 hypothetical protein [Pseudomonas aeruginosa]MCO4052119.1 hypothetical protein [Pseudomonas aeruginosa]MDE9400321.1 hypothetical protein [Pseudomonas aeruginosa]
MESIDDRVRTLVDKAGIDELVKQTDIGSTRWRTVRYDKRTRISTQEVEALVRIYPQYALWLASGQVSPESGQTSPDYDEANRNLSDQDAG